MLDSSGIVIATVHSMLVVVDIVGNALVCAIIMKNRDMRKPIHCLLVNLAVADIMYATFIAPDTFLKLVSTLPGGKTGTVLCQLLIGGNIAWVGAVSSAVTLVAIAIERFYAIVHPLGNEGQLTKCKLKVLIFGSWTFALVLTIPLFLVMNVKGNFCHSFWPEKWMPMAFSWVWFVLVLFSVALMAGLYARVVFILWFKRHDNSQLTDQQRGVVKVRKRVTLMVITVTTLFGICWLTDAVAHVVEDSTSYTAIDKVVFTVIHTMVLFNSAANPFVYALINLNFRKKMKEIIFCTGSPAVRNRVKRQPRDTTFTNTTHTAHTAGTSSRV
ncbi:hypothetical protein ACROYT_G043678 [Oculina patagonica]